MYIGDNILKLRETIPNGVELIAVSKFHPNEAIMDAYEVGQRVFGESRATELKAKATSLPKCTKMVERRTKMHQDTFVSKIAL